MSHRNAPLSLEGRRRLVARCRARPLAHVAAEMGISRQCASKWVNRYRRHALAPPQQPGQLRVGHIGWFIEDRTRRREELYGLCEVENVAALLRLEPIASLIATEVHSALRQRVPLKVTAVAGYSDGELYCLVSAARGDLARIRKRLVLGEAALSSLDRPGMRAGLDLDCARTLRKLELGVELSEEDNYSSARRTRRHRPRVDRWGHRDVAGQ